MKKERNEKILKSCLKGKIKFTASLLVAFLITGAIASKDVNAATTADGLIQINSTGVASISTGTTAAGTGAIAIGEGAITKSTIHGGTGKSSEEKNMISIGTGAVTNQENAIAIGTNAGKEGTWYNKTGIPNAAGRMGSTYNSISIGTGANSLINGVAIGTSAKSDFSSSVAIGINAVAGNGGKNGTNQSEASTAVGADSKAIGNGSNAFGSEAQANATNAFAAGRKVAANGQGDTAIGYNTSASGGNSIAIGYETHSRAQSGIAIGRSTIAGGADALAIGTEANAKQYSIAVGRNAESDGNYAAAFGLLAKAKAERGTALGARSSVTQNYGVALGSESVASIPGGTEGFDASRAVTGDNRTNNYVSLTNNTGNAKTSTRAGVSIGGAVGGGQVQTRQLHNLAAGTLDTDAVNIAQLKSVNLGFSGDSGRGDVRLFDQRLEVVGENGITTIASDKKITIKAGTRNYMSNIDGKATLDNNGTALPVNPNGTVNMTGVTNVDGLVKGSDVANAINNSYWNITAEKDATTTSGNVSGTSVTSVKPGETVKLIAGNNVNITQTGSNFKFEVNNPIEVINKTTNASEFYQAGDNLSATTGKHETTGTDVITYSLKPNITVDSVSINGNNKTNISDGKISGLESHITPNNSTSGTLPDNLKNAQNEPAKSKMQEAATVGDVLNAGWNLQGNGKAVDFVKAYDTVNFENGDNTEVSVELVNNDLTKSVIKTNLSKNLKNMNSIQLVDTSGNNTMLNGGGTTIINQNGDRVNITPNGITINPASNINADGSIKDTSKTISITNEGISAGGKQITNVVAGTKDTDAVNVGQLKEATQGFKDQSKAINRLNEKIDKVEGKMKQGFANAAAMSTLEFMEIGINQVAVGAAVGTYEGSQAVAVGIQGAPTENTRVYSKVSIAPGTRGRDTKTMAGVGATWRFNLK